MKKILIIALIVLIGTVGKSQTVTNNTGCNVSVTPLCYNPNTYGINCLAPVAINFVTSVSGFATMQSISDCSPSPRVAVGYQVCWDDASCGRTCVTLDAGGSAGYSDCHTSSGGYDGAPWTWVGTTSATLPACGTCSTTAVTVSINTATDHIQIN